MLSRVTLLLILFSNAIYAEEIITVLGKSEAEELKEAPVAVNVIDTKKAGKESSTLRRVRLTHCLHSLPVLVIENLRVRSGVAIKP